MPVLTLSLSTTAAMMHTRALASTLAALSILTVPTLCTPTYSTMKRFYFPTSRQSKQFPLLFTAIQTNIPLGKARDNGQTHSYKNPKNKKNKKNNTDSTWVNFSKNNHLNPKQAFGYSHATELRRLLLHHTAVIPVLYVHIDDVLTMPLNIEHVVPASVLKASPNPDAQFDPCNFYLSLATVNSARKNYRISFELLHRKMSDFLQDKTTPNSKIRHIGYGNCVDDENQLFYPRVQDIPTIARVILTMQRKWTFPLHEVTTANADELLRIAFSTPLTLREHTQQLLLSSISQKLLQFPEK